MGYRIRYAVPAGKPWRWALAGICLGVLICCVIGLRPVWQSVAAGEGLYDALARFVGGQILGPH